MSSTTDPLKKQAGEAAADEPSSKKAKLDENKPTDTNNGTTANDENVDQENNNGGTSKTTNKTPNKSTNGRDKEIEEEYEDDEGDDSGNLDGVFDPKIAKCLEQVENIQTEICNLNETASEEILKVEQKFNKLRRPHFEKRNELLKEIPNFWLTSLANHPSIAPMIESAEDEDCLHYMVNLDVEEFEDIKSGYKLKLHFIENPYITNDVIVKEFRLLSPDAAMSSTATPIIYKDTPQGDSLKQVVENSIVQYRRSRRPGQTQQSFFAWLVDQTESSEGPDEVAETLKDQIWPNPLEFFFATPDEYGADEESDDEDEEIDDEDIEDEEDGVITEGVDFSDEEIEGEEEDDDDDVEGLE